MMVGDCVYQVSCSCRAITITAGIYSLKNVQGVAEKSSPSEFLPISQKRLRIVKNKIFIYVHTTDNISLTSMTAKLQSFFSMTT